MKKSLTDKLLTSFPKIAFRKDVPYKQITTLGIGSTLPLLAEVGDEKNLRALLKFLKNEKINFFLFGAGSNVIGMDAPYDGIGLRLVGENFTSITFAGNTVRLGGAARLPLLAKQAAKHALGGLSPLCGIPGTIGGALRMNAGANGTEIGSFVRKIRGFLPDGEAFASTGSDVVWSYRSSSLPEQLIVTEVELELTYSTTECEDKLISDELARRSSREPASRSAGCTFRNISDLESAGLLIDRCHLKNCRIGDVAVSDKHANFLVNLGNGTERDFCALACLIRHAVAEKTGFFLTFENKMLNNKLGAQLAAFPPAPRVNVLYGGVSSEREVSLRSGAAVANALKNAGFQVELTDLKRCMVTESMRRADVVYPVLHGGFGEGGQLQKKLENANIRFCCSGSEASELVMDKIATKKLLDYLRIPTARWAVLTPQKRTLPPGFAFPVVVKVPREGSTVGIVKIDSPKDYDRLLDKEFALADELLVEEFISGVEITVPILMGEALDAIEIRSPHGFYDYDAKYLYKYGHTQYFCPPESLEEKVIDHAKHLAILFYHATGCRDLLRVDFIIDSTGVPMMLEGNSLPGCTATSLVPKAARRAGISLEKLTATLTYAALKRPAAPADEKLTVYSCKKI